MRRPKIHSFWHGDVWHCNVSICVSLCRCRSSAKRCHSTEATGGTSAKSARPGSSLPGKAHQPCLQLCSPLSIVSLSHLEPRWKDQHSWPPAYGVFWINTLMSLPACLTSLKEWFIQKFKLCCRLLTLMSFQRFSSTKWDLFYGSTVLQYVSSGVNTNHIHLIIHVFTFSPVASQRCSANKSCYVGHHPAQ